MTVEQGKLALVEPAIATARGSAVVELEAGAKQQGILFDVTAAPVAPGAGPSGDVLVDALNLVTGASTRYRLDAHAQKFLISQLEQSLTIQTWLSKSSTPPRAPSWFARLFRGA